MGEAKRRELVMVKPCTLPSHQIYSTARRYAIDLEMVVKVRIAHRTTYSLSQVDEVQKNAQKP
jgi:hypothetical protein